VNIYISVYLQFYLATDNNAKAKYAVSQKQETQLSQRDRSTLRVIKYFAQSLKVTQGHSK